MQKQHFLFINDNILSKYILQFICLNVERQKAWFFLSQILNSFLILVTEERDYNVITRYTMYGCSRRCCIGSVAVQEQSFCSRRGESSINHVAFLCLPSLCKLSATPSVTASQHRRRSQRRRRLALSSNLRRQVSRRPYKNATRNNSSPRLAIQIQYSKVLLPSLWHAPYLHNARRVARLPPPTTTSSRSRLASFLLPLRSNPLPRADDYARKSDFLTTSGVRIIICFVIDCKDFSDFKT